MKKFLAVLLLTIIVAMSQQVYAAFEDTYWGVRALGMGGAFTAVANDANAPLYNIAGIANCGQKEITLMGSRLFAGLDGVEIAANYLGAVYPVTEEWGSVSFAWSSLGTPALARYDTFNLGYARKVNDLLEVDEEFVMLSAGLNLKYLRQEINFDEEDKDLSDSKGAVTCDIGLLATFENGLRLGFSSKYLTSPDMGYEEKDSVKNMTVFGIGYFSELLPYVNIPTFTADLDLILIDGETKFRLGLESYVLDDKLGIRLGGREEAVNIGFGYEFVFANEATLIVDYAFELPFEIEESYGSHFIALSFRFN
ncbi:MAG: hypothetical protein IKN62_06060 [Elusimicrobia bacterium]|nr:hypothetical protein [Elusimicrobiota bacterium]